MTVIYLDMLFLLNAVMDYLLLLCSARLAGEELHRSRMALGAMFGGAYAAAAVLPGMNFLLRPEFKAGAAILMVVTGLGGSRRLLRQTVIFFALTCAFGGGVLAVSLLGGTGLSLGGVIYSGMDIKIVLLSAAGCYVLFTMGLARTGKHTAAAGELVRVQVCLADREISLTALVDTGNTLTDPVSGRAVMVADGAALFSLFPRGEGPDEQTLAAPAQALSRLNTGCFRGRFRLLPYRAVGVECGLLLAVRPDSVRLEGRECSPMLVALSPTPVSDGGGYRALVGSTCEK